MDGAVHERLGTFYKASSDEHKIDFNFCHPIWKKYYITIDPPSQQNKSLYFAIGLIAALINIAALLIGFYVIYKLAEQKEVTNKTTDSAIVEGWKKLKKCFTILLPVMLQVVDSLLDALYFIKLKTSYRIIQVPPFVHIMQALLLFTCKLPVSHL